MSGQEAFALAMLGLWMLLAGYCTVATLVILFRRL
jgi:hypothetical protein